MKIVYKVVLVSNGYFTSIFHLTLDAVHYELGKVTRPIKVKDAVYGRLFVFDTLENARNLLISKFMLPTGANFAILKCETNRCFKALLNKQQMVRYAKHNHSSFKEAEVYINSYKGSVPKGTLYCDSVKPIEIVQ